MLFNFKKRSIIRKELPNTEGSNRSILGLEGDLSRAVEVKVTVFSFEIRGYQIEVSIEKLKPL